ncbi:MAG: DUF1801 domain-containing protein [Planctomycetes bacterium]|jgi:uncharacterized protein YdhG (YjbR/CyaY superfamily)|nr:DUF1801 domain-containing protein [Planctomycetota bacterium]
MADHPKTVADYLDALPPDRRAAIETVRTVILANLDRDYEEGIQYGMLGYYIPHRVFPAGYHCDPKQPLPFAALASQKNYMSLYLMSVYGDEASAKTFREAWLKTGKKLDMGKACIRFTDADQVALNVVGDTIRRMPAKRWIEVYEASRKGEASKAKPAPKSAKPTAAKPVAKKAAKKAAAKPAAKAPAKQPAAKGKVSKAGSKR